MRSVGGDEASESGDHDQHEEKIYVAVRARPLSRKEISKHDLSDWECINNTTIIFKNSLQERSLLPSAYTFDRVFGFDSPTKHVYDEAAKKIALSALSGINSTIFAYGQTGSGKTFTMQGITEYAIVDIYDYIEKHRERNFELKFCAMEIYNEAVRDLLRTDPTPLRLLDDPERGTIVANLTEVTLKDLYQLQELLAICEAQRQIGETSLNDFSSRSHQILRLTIESESVNYLGAQSSSTLTASVNFVDLAGSERASQTHSAGTRLKEGCHINRSLLTLGTVIRKLSKGGKNGHIPYRDSKLTRILQNSLGGNARTAIICTMSPAHSHVEQSRNTLHFANCAKHVSTNAQVNVMMSEKALVKQLQKELARMESELKNIQSLSHAAGAPKTALKEKELLIQKMDREIRELTHQRDQAQSRFEDMLRSGGEHQSSKSWADEYSASEASELMDPLSLGIVSGYDNKIQDYNNEEQFLVSTTTPRLYIDKYFGPDPSQGWEKIAQQTHPVETRRSSISKNSISRTPSRNSISRTSSRNSFSSASSPHPSYRESSRHIESTCNRESSRHTESSHRIESPRNRESPRYRESLRHTELPNYRESSHHIGSPGYRESSRQPTYRESSAHHTESPRNRESTRYRESSQHIGSPNYRGSSHHIESPRHTESPSYRESSHYIESPRNRELSPRYGGESPLRRAAGRSHSLDFEASGRTNKSCEAILASVMNSPGREVAKEKEKPLQIETAPPEKISVKKTLAALMRENSRRLSRQYSSNSLYTENYSPRSSDATTPSYNDALSRQDSELFSDAKTLSRNNSGMLSDVTLSRQNSRKSLGGAKSLYEDQNIMSPSKQQETSAVTKPVKQIDPDLREMKKERTINCQDENAECNTKKEKTSEEIKPVKAKKPKESAENKSKKEKKSSCPEETATAEGKAKKEKRSSGTEEIASSKGKKERNETTAGDSDWNTEFQRRLKEIIKLWDACHIPLVHRSYFCLLFKGDPSDAVYMEVELRRLSFLKTGATSNKDEVPPSPKALHREREMLSRRMLKKLNTKEREALFEKWDIDVKSKQRRQQLCRKLWTDTEDMEHVNESAAIVAKLAGLKEAGQAPKEMFGLSLVPKQNNSKAFSWRHPIPSII